MKSVFSALPCLLFTLSISGVTDAQVNTSPYELVEILRIGDESRGDSILLTNHEFARMGVGSDNQIFIGGERPRPPVFPVLSFSDEGHFTGFVAPKRRCPGEFWQSDSVIIGPRDSIYVYDSHLDIF